ncbi:hypothetical protein FKW77_010568 [Venturia effusa]|uniref:Uncharacterized protein n=1 Tax=Venturia effusa TaxID=50376 RepID=A0A517KXV3_9PEZI|nr:hypothetical protein FKW77_010568 [Venturia effusa]
MTGSLRINRITSAFMTVYHWQHSHRSAGHFSDGQKRAFHESEKFFHAEMCIHKCYVFQCGHRLLVPGAKVVCDLAMVALLTPAPGTPAGHRFVLDRETPRIQREAADIALPQSPEAGYRNEEDLRMTGFEVKAFSGVCTPRGHGFYSNKIERLCSSCKGENDEAAELAKMQLEEASRRASQLNTEPEREYATDVESMLSASEADATAVTSMRNPESIIPMQQRKTSSGFGSLMNVFKRN